MAIKTLALRSPGETGEDALHPLLSDGSTPEAIALDRYDGGNIETLMSSAVSVGEVGGESVRIVQRVRKVKVRVYITDGRVALICEKWDKGMRADARVVSPVYLVVMLISKLRAARRTKNQAMVGQLRYLWVSQVGASVKGPRNTPDAIRIRYVERYPGMDLHKVLTINLDGYDTPRIAQDIARRVAVYRLANFPDMKDEERDKFARLRDDPPLLQPEPTKFAFIKMPTFYPVTINTAFPDRMPVSPD